MTDWTAPTFELLTFAGRDAIRCLLCYRISELRGDIDNRYCARCHLFHEAVALARQMAAGVLATHDCSEWRTWLNICAVCARKLQRVNP